MPHTFSSNYSFIANFLDEEIKKRKNHISLRVGKFPRFEIFNFPTRREIPYASVQTDKQTMVPSWSAILGSVP